VWKRTIIFLSFDIYDHILNIIWLFSYQLNHHPRLYRTINFHSNQAIKIFPWESPDITIPYISVVNFAVDLSFVTRLLPNFRIFFVFEPVKIADSAEIGNIHCDSSPNFTLWPFYFIFFFDRPIIILILSWAFFDRSSLWPEKKIFILHWKI